MPFILCLLVLMMLMLCADLRWNNLGNKKYMLETCAPLFLPPHTLYLARCVYWFLKFRRQSHTQCITHRAFSWGTRSVTVSNWWRHSAKSNDVTTCCAMLFHRDVAFALEAGSNAWCECVFCIKANEKKQTCKVNETVAIIHFVGVYWKWHSSCEISGFRVQFFFIHFANILLSNGISLNINDLWFNSLPLSSTV